jgi:hypothetical protein
VGTDRGTVATVTFYSPDRAVRFSARPFGDSFTGGVRVASGDVTGDGVPDVVAGTGPGIATRVLVLDGATGNPVADLGPFEASFTGGVYVAAGDLDGDGRDDVVVTPDEGGGPRVLVYRGGDFALVANFFGIDDPAFRGGARAAVGDVSADGRADLLVAAGFGGGPRVAFFDGRTVAGGQPPVALFGDIFAFDGPDAETLRNGVFVAAGDFDADGFADLVAGGGPGGGPRVLIRSGADLTDGSRVLANFFAGNPDNRGGIRVGVQDLDGDGRADLTVGDGAGAGSRVTGYSGSSLANGTAPEALAFDAAPGFTGGVFVG